MRIYLVAKQNGYKNIISVSLGSRVHSYKHNDIAKDVINELNELVNKYDIGFNFVLLNKIIRYFILLICYNRFRK